MDANTASAWSAIAAVGSAFAAFGALAVAMHAKSVQGNSTDFSNCLEVVSQLRDAMRRVHDASGDNDTNFEFTELLNLLETLALLYNKGKIAAATKKFTGDFLEQAIGWIKTDAGMRERMQKSRTATGTYRELERFETKRRALILNNVKQHALDKGLKLSNVDAQSLDRTSLRQRPS